MTPTQLTVFTSASAFASQNVAVGNFDHRHDVSMEYPRAFAPSGLREIAFARALGIAPHLGVNLNVLDHRTRGRHRGYETAVDCHITYRSDTLRFPLIMATKMRYGVGELLARSLGSLTPQVRAELVQQRLQGAAVCPPKETCYGFDPNGIPKGGVNCTKPGGICSVRRYQAEFQTQRVASILPETIQAIGTFATICPHRFIEAGAIYAWIGSELLGTNRPQIVRELAFLESTTAAPEQTQEGEEAVGRLDCVLVKPDAPVLTWCAVEMQAVYLSNSKTNTELNNLIDCPHPVPFPVTNPRPDYRSSGPKRLLPQLQVKVPTLSRWGIKMAVVIDKEFFDSMGKMEEANHPSNSDIAWFVMDYQQTPEGRATLQPGTVHYTTLPEAIEGLVGADAIPKPAFETAIAAKLRANYP